MCHLWMTSIRESFSCAFCSQMDQNFPCCYFLILEKSHCDKSQSFVWLSDWVGMPSHYQQCLQLSFSSLLEESSSHFPLQPASKKQGLLSGSQQWCSWSAWITADSAPHPALPSIQRSSSPQHSQVFSSLGKPFQPCSSLFFGNQSLTIIPSSSQPLSPFKFILFSCLLLLSLPLWTSLSDCKTSLF